jgi:hypothetical protein
MDSEGYLGLTGDEKTDRDIIAKLIEKHRRKQISGFHQFLEELSAKKKAEIAAEKEAQEEDDTKEYNNSVRRRRIERDYLISGKKYELTPAEKNRVNQRMQLSHEIPNPGFLPDINPRKGGKKRKTKRRRHSKKKYSFPKKTRKTRHRKRRNSV